MTNVEIEEYLVGLEEKLELLFCERKSIEELCELFGRSSGGIYARIEKLELIEKYGGY